MATKRTGRWIARREERLLAWEAAKPGRHNKACYRAYSQVFIPVAIIALAVFPLTGRELLWNIDGLTQYYPFFVYEGQWLRDIFSTLISGGGLQIPLWEWCSGYGADVPTTFDVFFDPLNLLSGLCPEKYSEYLFQLLVMVRMYLGGLTFCVYCMQRGEGRYATVVGALLYSLCGAALVGLRWTSGLPAFVLFPLLLAGAERILAHKSPWMFLVSLFLFLVVTYYFAYMAIILFIVYMVVRVIMLEKPLTLRKFFRWVGIFAGLSVIAGLLACFVLIPAITALLNMGRVTDENASIPLLYSLKYCISLISAFLGMGDIDSDTVMGFGGVALIACFVLFSYRGRNQVLKWAFVALTLCLFIPWVGSFMNGLNYATNRWAWAYALCVCFIVTRMTPELLHLSDADHAHQRRAVIVGVCVFAALFLIDNIRTENNVAAYCAMFAVLLIVFYAGFTETVRRRMLLLGTALCMIIGVFYYVNASENGIGGSSTVIGTSYNMLTENSSNSVALSVDDQQFWRYDSSQTRYGAISPIWRIHNDSLVLGLRGIDFYNSIYNGDVDRFHTELGVAGDYINFMYNDLQDRTDLLTLMSVKYFAFLNNGTDTAPYGYGNVDAATKTTVGGVDYALVEGDETLPLGFTYSSHISRETYESLTPIQKQQALLQGVVLDDSSLPELTASDLSYEDSELPFTVVSTDGLTYEDGTVKASKNGASMTIQVQGIPASDTYLYFTGLDYSGLKPSEFYSAEQLAGMKWYNRAALIFKDFQYSAPTFYVAYAQANSGSTNRYLANYTKSSHMYGGKDNWLLDLGYSEQSVNTITITFSSAGLYTFDGLQALSQTYNGYAEQVKALREDTLQDVSIGCNTLSGNITLPTSKTLFLSIPWSTGWSATVDGNPATLEKADTAFMALELSEGTHTVELHYVTPGLEVGGMLSATGALALIVLIVIYRKKSARVRTRTDEKRAEVI